MTRFFLIGLTSAALLLAAPALAQNNMSSMNSTGATAPSDTSTMTCDQMMTKAQSMSANSAAAMTMAKNEMHMAQAAKDKNDEAGCKTHMQNAMKDMR